MDLRLQAVPLATAWQSDIGALKREPETCARGSDLSNLLQNMALLGDKRGMGKRIKLANKGFATPRISPARDLVIEGLLAPADRRAKVA